MKTTTKKKLSTRALTRGEIKKLRKKGINLAALRVDQAEEAVDEVLAMIFGENNPDVDALENIKAMNLFKETIDLSYGKPSETESKNSSTSGATTKAADAE